MTRETGLANLKRKRVPYCASCWDKGYATVLQTFHQATDFEGDKVKAVNRIFEKRNYCYCKGGQRLKRKENASMSEKN